MTTVTQLKNYLIGLEENGEGDKPLEVMLHVHTDPVKLTTQEHISLPGGLFLSYDKIYS